MGRYLVDAMCGRLARYLRFCGHDAAYVGDRDAGDDAALAARAAAEGRTVITRDRRLAELAEAAILLDEVDLDGQLRAVDAAGVPLEIAEAPRRCGRCNGRLDPLPGDVDAPDYVPVDVDARRCARCGQYFWRGSHWASVRARLEALDPRD